MIIPRKEDEPTEVHELSIETDAISVSTIEISTIDINPVDDILIDAITINKKTIDANTVEISTIEISTIEISTIEISTIDLSTIDLSTIEVTNLRTARSLTKESASNRLVKAKAAVYREEIEGSITFTMTGIKECINQPFHAYIEKLNLISEGLEAALQQAEYIGFTNEQTHPKPHVKGYHFFKTEIGGKPAYFNVQKNDKGDLVLYSITDYLGYKK